MTTSILYSGTRNASSWAMRAWLALRAADYPFDDIVVDIRRPQRFQNLAQIAKISPSATVPVLLTDECAIFDSIAIMEFANDICGGRLLPKNIAARAQARSFMAWQHSGLSGICARISFESAFYPYKRQLTVEEQAEVARFCQAIEPILAQSSGPFLFEDISLADFMLAPTVIRLSRHNPQLERWPKSAQWMRAVLAHPLVTEWLEDADQQQHIWFENYLVPDQPQILERGDHGAPVNDPPRVDACLIQPHTET